MECHPLCLLFPLMVGDDWDDLQRDITQQGVREPIVLYQGKILDGRHRYIMATSIGVDVKDIPTREFEGDDAAALDFVISTNVLRRHLNDSQRAMIAAQVVTSRWGGYHNQEALNASCVTVAQASRAARVSARAVTQAKKVTERAPPEVVENVRSGKMSLNQGEKLTPNKATTKPKKKLAALQAAPPAPEEPMIEKAVKAFKTRHVTDVEEAYREGWRDREALG